MNLVVIVALTLSAQLPSDSAVSAMLAPRVQALPDSGKHGEGIVVALLDKGQRVISIGGVDVDDVFEIGSITKVFTASLLADMVARGQLRLNDPVAQYLPRSLRMPVHGRPITLLDLAAQSSGLPRMPDNFTPRDSSNPYADYSVQQLYEFLSRYQLPRDPGATYEYSNLGMGLLGHVLALKAGMNYERLVARRILAPLGMKETAITLTKAMQTRLAPGHDGEGHVVPNWDLPTLAGAGALRSTATDLLGFLVANLDSAATPLSRTLVQTHAERQATRISRSDSPGTSSHGRSGKSCGTTGERAAIAASSASIRPAASASSCSVTTAMKTSMTSAFICWTRRSRSEPRRHGAPKWRSTR